MDPREPGKTLTAEKINAAARFKRRYTYNQISADRREELLLMQRMKRQQPAKHSLPKNQNIIILGQSTSSASKLTLPRQPTLTIRELPPVVEKAMYPQPCIATPHNNLEKGKEICSPSVINTSELMSAEENNNYSSPAKSYAEMELEHHEIYGLIFAKEGEVLLLQCQINRQELKENIDSEVVAFPVHGKYTVDLQRHFLSSQDCFPMNSSSTSAITVNESHVVSLSTATGKQQNIAPSFYAYEVGSTSGTSNAKSDLP